MSPHFWMTGLCTLRPSHQPAPRADSTTSAKRYGPSGFSLTARTISLATPQPGWNGSVWGQREANMW